MESKSALEASARYRAKHKEKIAKRDAEYRQRNKDKIRTQDREYCKTENGREVRKRVTDKQNARYHTEPEFKLKKLMRERLRKALLAKGIKKTTSALKLCGCTLEELKSHLQSQFTEGMSWDNYGKDGWEVDHIVPCDKFNFNNEEEQLKCFHYSNLQPLWAIDNRKKSNKVNL